MRGPGGGEGQRVRQGAWAPSLGAWPEASGTRFRVWAPERDRVELVLEGDGERVVPLERGAGGYWEAAVPGVGPGALYRYRLDRDQAYPDPAARFQSGRP